MLLDYPKEICGYPVETDYKFWLKYVSSVMDTRDLHPQEKIPVIVNNIFDIWNVSQEETVRLFSGAIQFYNCGKEDRGLTPPNEPLIHWGRDMNNIRADFLLYYKIDINCDDTHMHWWEFRGMFDSLPSESKINSLISIRAEDPNDYRGKGQEKSYQACIERKRMAAVWPDQYGEEYNG